MAKLAGLEGARRLRVAGLPSDTADATGGPCPIHFKTPESRRCLAPLATMPDLAGTPHV